MGRPRRWLRYVLAAAVAAMVALSCAASFDPPSKINKLRVLAVTADRPAARASRRGLAGTSRRFSPGPAPGGGHPDGRLRGQ